MSDKLIIPFEGKKESEIDTSGTFSFIGYERLRKLLENDCGNMYGERITGLVIEKEGINIRFDK
jgi:hypothetical protein